MGFRRGLPARRTAGKRGRLLPRPPPDTPPTELTDARASAASRSPFTGWRRLGDAGSARFSRGCANGGSRNVIRT
eukprot:4378572-Pleurochrysis_carterae.AAC.1